MPWGAYTTERVTNCGPVTRSALMLIELTRPETIAVEKAMGRRIKRLP
jgi:hypothetical protein